MLVHWLELRLRSPLRRPGFVLQSAITDSNGIYAFCGLQAAKYNVTETLPSGYAYKSPKDGNIVVTLVAGQNSTDQNFVDLRITPSPTSAPTQGPTKAPTPLPSAVPTASPTSLPTLKPTVATNSKPNYSTFTSSTGFHLG